MKEGDSPAACKKLEASDKLDPSAGTELNLADCRTKTGELATAWGMFVKAAASAKRVHDDKKESEARRRAAELESQLVYLTIKVPEDNRVDELVVKRNRDVVDPALWGERVPIDPGDYTIAARAPGHEPWSTQITIEKKDKTVVVPALEASEPSDPADHDHEHERHRRARTDDDTDPDPEAPHGRRFTAATVTLAVVGGGALVGAIAFASAASSLENESDALCPAAGCGDPHGYDLNRRARRDALVANIGFGVGGAALVGAAIFLFAGAPSHHAAKVAIVPANTGLGLAVGGHF